MTYLIASLYVVGALAVLLVLALSYLMLARAEAAGAELERRRLARATDPQAFMLDAPMVVATPADTASNELQRRRA